MTEIIIGIIRGFIGANYSKQAAVGGFLAVAIAAFSYFFMDWFVGRFLLIRGSDLSYGIYCISAAIGGTLVSLVGRKKEKRYYIDFDLIPR